MPDFGSATCYGAWKYNAARLAIKEANAVRLLDAAMARHPTASHAAVHGTSGMWVAPALLKAGFKVLLVRKPGEQTHGEPIEGSPGPCTGVILVDDFVCSGATVSRVRNILLAYAIPLLDVVQHSPDQY